MLMLVMGRWEAKAERNHGHASVAMAPTGKNTGKMSVPLNFTFYSYMECVLAVFWLFQIQCKRKPISEE